jgi:hypothetical protein
VNSANENSEISKVKLIVFSAVLVVSLARTEIHTAEKWFVQFTEYVTNHRSLFGETCDPLLAYLATSLVAVKQMVPGFDGRQVADLMSKIEGVDLSLLCLSSLVTNDVQLDNKWLACFSDSPVAYRDASEGLFLQLSRSFDPQTVCTLLTNLSMAIAGQPSFFMHSQPDLVFGWAGIPPVRTPTGILIGCSEVLLLFRRLLTTPSTQEYLVCTFTYILTQFVYTQEVNSTPGSFDDPILLYGVFSILSHVVDCIRPRSVVQDSRDGSAYYIASIDGHTNVAVAWQLPINATSTPVTFKLDPHFRLAPDIYCHSLFPNQPLLVDCFLKLPKELPIPLTFLISASLLEFITDSSFLDLFLLRHGPFRLPIIYHTDSLWAFYYQLDAALLLPNTSEPSPELSFHLFSPQETVPPLRVSALDFSLRPRLFISDVLPWKKETTLILRLSEHTQAVVYLLSLTVPEEGSVLQLLPSACNFMCPAACAPIARCFIVCGSNGSANYTFGTTADPAPSVIFPTSSGHSAVPSLLQFNCFLSSQPYGKNTFVNYVEDRRQGIRVNPIIGKQSGAESDFSEIRYLPSFSLENFPSLPHFLRAALTDRFARLRVVETENGLFRHCLAVRPVFETLQLFTVSPSDLVRHFLQFLLSIEPLDHPAISRGGCPLQFAWNALDPSTPYDHPALRAVVAHIRTEAIAGPFADAWHETLRRQMASSDCHFGRGAPYAVLREVSGEQFVLQERFEKRFVIVRMGERHDFRWAVNGVQSHGRLAFVVGRALTIKIPLGEREIFGIFDAGDSRRLIGTFYEFALSLKYFVHFLASVCLESGATFRESVYSIVIQAVRSGSPFFATFSGQVLSFLRDTIPVPRAKLPPDVAHLMDRFSNECRDGEAARSFNGRAGGLRVPVSISAPVG